MLNEIKQDLHPRKLISIFAAGAIIAVLYLPSIISISILVYSGSLAQYASIGIGISIMGTIIVQFFTAFGSTHNGIMGGPQDSPASIIAVAAASISAGMIAASQEARFATILMTIMLTTFLTGMFFILVGYFNLSRFIRFLPYPVIGGFISGTGLLIIRGGFSIMTDISLNAENLALFFQPAVLIRWIPGLILALILFITGRKFTHFLVMPSLLLISVILFYVITLPLGMTADKMHTLGWLLGPFPSGALWKPLDFSIFAQVHWDMVASNISSLFAIGVISIMGLLLNVSALELIAQEDIDARRELEVMGAANLVVSLFGGGVSYHYLGLSGLATNMKASRLVSVAAAIILGIVMLFGAEVLSLLPKFAIGGLLISVGISFLTEWVYNAWFRMPKMEYLLVLAILAVVGFVGFLEGVSVGVIGAVILFAVNYGRIDVVNDALTSVTYRSNTERPPEHYQRLERYGNQVNILRLHGFVFFGTAHTLLNRIRSRINNTETLGELKYLVLDFHRVTSLDSSAALSFTRIYQLTKTNQIHLIFTDVAEDIRRSLELSNLKEEAGNLFRYFPTLDHGAEWCETHILTVNETATLIRAATLRGQLNSIFGRDNAEKFMNYLVRENLEANTVLFRQGDPSSSMFFIESGQVTASFSTSDERDIRLRTMGAGTAIGEIAVYLRQPRTATITSTKATVVYQLTAEALKEMEKNDSEVAARAHAWLATILSQRVADYNRTLEVLLN